MPEFLGTFKTNNTGGFWPINLPGVDETNYAEIAFAEAFTDKKFVDLSAGQVPYLYMKFQSRGNFELEWERTELVGLCHMVPKFVQSWENTQFQAVFEQSYQFSIKEGFFGPKPLIMFLFQSGFGISENVNLVINYDIVPITDIDAAKISAKLGTA